MKKIIKLTESDLTRIVKKVINEQNFKPKKGEITVSPRILISCEHRRIMRSDLPVNLEGNCNRTIIDHFCEKYKDNLSLDD